MMRNFLLGEGMWKIVTGRNTKPEADKIYELIQKRQDTNLDCKFCWNLNHVHMTWLGAAKAMWDYLEGIYVQADFYLFFEW